MSNVKTNKMELSRIEVEELACVITGLNYDDIDGDEVIIEEKLYNEFNLDLDMFHDLILKLTPLIMVAKSPLTEIVYKGFANIEEKRWILKTEL